MPITILRPDPAPTRPFGRRAGEELGVPIFLYEAAAAQEHRKSLRQIRAGEYEGLAERLTKPEWKPDVGPAEHVPSRGATATGSQGLARSLSRRRGG